MTRSSTLGVVSGSLGLALVLILLPAAPAHAQPVQIAKIGFLLAGPAPAPGTSLPLREALLRGLRELGWIEGKNLALETRYAAWKMESLPGLAGELVDAKVDLIVTGGYRPILAARARAATSAIPVVVTSCDPVEVLVGSLARPGGNVTGSTCMSAEVSPKKLQFLKEAVPSASRIAVLFNPDDPGPTLGMKLMLEAAPALQVRLQPLRVSTDAEVAGALITLGRDRPDALLVYPDFVTGRNQPKILEFAAKQRLPAMYGFREWADAGGMMSYGSNLQEQFYRAAFIIDKILKGAKPGDIPIEQPTRFELVVNLRAARMLGVSISPSVLGRADQILE
jgi:putative ABC transport system substrate-binding protein